MPYPEPATADALYDAGDPLRERAAAAALIAQLATLAGLFPGGRPSCASPRRPPGSTSRPRVLRSCAPWSTSASGSSPGRTATTSRRPPPGIWLADDATFAHALAGWRTTDAAGGLVLGEGPVPGEVALERFQA